MKKTLAILLVLVMFVIGVYGLIDQMSPKPPLPSVTVEGEKVTTVQGSYCWSGYFNSQCVDMISPPELIKEKGIKSVSVPPQSRLKIEFKNAPIRNTLGVNKWEKNGKVKNIYIKNNILTAPKEKGVYLYDIFARWEKGSSSYVFVIEVK